MSESRGESRRRRKPPELLSDVVGKTIIEALIMSHSCIDLEDTQKQDIPRKLVHRDRDKKILLARHDIETVSTSNSHGLVDNTENILEVCSNCENMAQQS